MGIDLVQLYSVQGPVLKDLGWSLIIFTWVKGAVLQVYVRGRFLWSAHGGQSNMTIAAVWSACVQTYLAVDDFHTGPVSNTHLFLHNTYTVI